MSNPKEVVETVELTEVSAESFRRRDPSDSELESAAAIVESFCRRYNIDRIEFHNFKRVTVPYVAAPFGGEMTALGLGDALRKATERR